MAVMMSKTWPKGWAPMAWRAALRPPAFSGAWEAAAQTQHGEYDAAGGVAALGLRDELERARVGGFLAVAALGDEEGEPAEDDEADAHHSVECLRTLRTDSAVLRGEFVGSPLRAQALVRTRNPRRALCERGPAGVRGAAFSSRSTSRTLAG